MNDKSALLGQLRIDRGSEPLDSPPRRYLWWAITVAVVLLIGAAVFYFTRPTGVPVQVAVARAATPGSATGGATLLDASGYVVARREATVSAKITGKVTEVLIEEGQHVTQGEIVGRLDDTNIRAELNQSLAQLAYASASLAQVKVNLANAERDFNRKNALIGQNFVSQSELDTARTTLDGLRAQLVTATRSVELAQRGVEVTQRNVNDTIVRAPFTGVVTVKAAQPGEIVSPISAGGGFTRTGIGTIVDMDSLEVEVDVNENFIGRVHAREPATITLNAYPDWKIPAYVIAIIPTADRSKATVKVRVGFEQRDERVLPDMGVRVAFLSDAPSAAAGAHAAEAGVIVPADAVQVRGETGVVFLLRGDAVERRAVKLGARGTEGQVILAGLSAGDRVAVGDLAQLSDGAKIRVVEAAH